MTKNRPSESNKSPAEERETNSPASGRGASKENEARATKSPPSKSNESPAETLQVDGTATLLNFVTLFYHAPAMLLHTAGALFYGLANYKQK